MAAPQVVKEIVSSNEFTYLNDIVSSASTIINESEAWARGTRGGAEVVSEDDFSYLIQSSIITAETSVNENTFRQKVGSKPGLQRIYKFTWTNNNNWELVCTTINGSVSKDDDPVSLNDLLSYGITLNTLGGADPNPNDTITVSIKEPDITYHNNAKYYAERAEDSSAQWIAAINSVGSQWNDTVASTGASYLDGTERYYNELVNLTVSAVSDINPGVVKTSSGTGEGYNFEFHLPKGDPGNVELMTCFVNVNDVDVSERSYGQLIFDTTDSLFQASIFRQPMENDTPKLLLNFNDRVFISKVGLLDLKPSNNYTYSYNFQYSTSQNKWYLDSVQQYVNLEEYGIAYTVKTGMTLNNNDIITISLKQQADFSIGEAGENEGILFLGIRTEG